MEHQNRENVERGMIPAKRHYHELGRRKITNDSEVNFIFQSIGDYHRVVLIWEKVINICAEHQKRKTVSQGILVPAGGYPRHLHMGVVDTQAETKFFPEGV
jgi:catechol-2,3-dioxygenase